MNNLDEAYERLHGKGPEFGGDEEGNNGLTNHGPMAVEVMVRRGLDVDVHQWLDRYLDRLHDLPDPKQLIDGQTWAHALGDPKRVGDWTAYFDRALAEAPWQSVLTTWWPRLLPGIVAGSTHGVIRVGHAVRTLRAGDTSAPALRELANGLAFWAARSRALPGFTEPVGTVATADALAGVPRLVDQSGLIARRVGRLAQLPGWSKALASLRAPADAEDVPARLDELIEAGVLRYRTHGQAAPVLLVHAATAPNAVQHVLPVLPKDLWQPSFAAAWAACAAITATYAPADPFGTSPISLDRTDPVADVLDRAARHGDEHVIKFADTAVDAYARSGNPDLLASSAYAGSLIR
ncbi:MAG TPA: questin oxidase family protein [Pseudonocardiaceae bacterium]|jgi:hypothetical protein